jgi:hypothetical protein
MRIIQGMVTGPGGLVARPLIKIWAGEGPPIPLALRMAMLSMINALCGSIRLPSDSRLTHVRRNCYGTASAVANTLSPSFQQRGHCSDSNLFTLSLSVPPYLLTRCTAQELCSMQCKICGAVTAPAFTAKILGKYAAVYYRCKACGFMQTEEPYWLKESYASAINEIDLGPINRAISSSKLIEGIVLSSFDKNAKFVDYGAGYGVLVRLMRDRGFDFYWQDRYCENLFAKHFRAELGSKFELLTAFEVFEHLVDPLAEIQTILDYSSNLLLSTLLVPNGVRTVTDWWYFGPEHGQHVSFYTVPALQNIAKRFGLHLCTNSMDLHLLSRKPISKRIFHFFARETRWSTIARTVMRRGMRKQSLLMDDFRAVSGYTV